MSYCLWGFFFPEGYGSEYWLPKPETFTGHYYWWWFISIFSFLGFLDLLWELNLLSMAGLYFSCTLLSWGSSVLLFSIDSSPFPFWKERYSGSWWGEKRGIWHLFLCLVSLNNGTGWNPSKVVVKITDIWGFGLFLLINFQIYNRKSLFLSMITTWIIFLTLIMEKKSQTSFLKLR